MGLLTKEKIDRINDLIDNANSGSIPIIVYMQKDSDYIWYNRFDAEVYFLENGDLEKCFKIQKKEIFENTINELKKEGWKIL